MAKNGNGGFKLPGISSKVWLSLILAIPLLALIAFSSLLVAGKVNIVSEMKTLDASSHFVAEVGDLVHEIQKERGYTMGFIGSNGKKFKDELFQQRAVLDKEHYKFLEALKELKGHPEAYGAIEQYINKALGTLDLLEEKRGAVDSQRINFFDALGYYTNMNANLLDVIVLMPRLTTDGEISSDYRSYYHWQQVKEKAGIQRALLTYAFSMGQFPPGIYERFLAIVANEQHSNRIFMILASPETKKRIEEVMRGPEVDEANRMRSLTVEKGAKGDFGVDAAVWNRMQTVKIDRIDNVREFLDGRIALLVDKRRAVAENSLRGYIVINLFVVGFVVSMAALLFRNISKRREAEEGLALYARRMERALFRAKDVLNSIAIPPQIIPYFTVSPVYRSLRSIGGGDSVKWLNFRSRYAALYLHDVAGHDIEEILLNILATSLVDIYKENHSKKSASIPPQFLNELNGHLCRFCEGTPDYLTAVYMLMDFDEREIRIASAGHPNPMLINPDGSVRVMEVPSGFMLGQFDIKPHDKERYSDLKVKLEPGQLLLLYSDGLMEQAGKDGVTFEQKFLKEIGRNLAGLEPEPAYELLKGAFEAHTGGRIPDDDVSFIIAGTRPADKYQTACFIPSAPLLSLINKHRMNRDTNPASRIPVTAFARDAAPDSLAVIESISKPYEPLLAKLKEAGWPERKRGYIEMALHEMIINAVMHGNRCSDKFWVELAWQLHAGVLEVCVTDKGYGFDGRMLPQSVEEIMLKNSGRGHLMINAVSDGVYFNDLGNRCWALFLKNGPMHEVAPGDYGVDGKDEFPVLFHA